MHRILSHHDVGRVLTRDLVTRVSQYITGDPSYDRGQLDALVARQGFAFTLSADERRGRACKAYDAVAGQLVLREDPRPYHDVGFEFTELDYLMRLICKNLYGSSWRKPARRAELPLVAAYLDYKRSKYGLKAPPLNELSFFHLHGLIVVPLDKVERASDLLPKLLQSLPARNGLLFDDPHVERFNPEMRHPDAMKDKRYADEQRSALEHWIQYSVKGAAQLSVTDYWSGELYRLYPNPNGPTYGYPRPPIGSPDRRVPFETVAASGMR